MIINEGLQFTAEKQVMSFSTAMVEYRRVEFGRMLGSTKENTLLFFTGHAVCIHQRISVSNWVPLNKATNQSKNLSSMGDMFADSYMD